MAWYDRLKKPKIRISETEKKSVVPEEGIWVRCMGCMEVVPKVDIEANLHVCPRCQFHYRISGKARIELLCDADSLKERDRDLKTADVLQFKDKKSYPQRIEEVQKSTKLPEAFCSFDGYLYGKQVHVGSFEFSFMGGSMGAVVGEKVARLFERGATSGNPVILFSASGGARMQEGIVSLMQLAKTSAARTKLSQVGVPFISILTDPTTGGVAASFAMQGDVIVAEPGALIGFAGPRVIEQTMNQELPEGFQRSEFLVEHGMIDRIVARSKLKDEVALVLKHLMGKKWAS